MCAASLPQNSRWVRTRRSLPRKGQSGELNPGRYFHIFYDDRRKTAERESLEDKIDRMAVYLQEHEGTKQDLDSRFRKYFDLIYYHKGKADEKFTHTLQIEQRTTIPTSGASAPTIGIKSFPLLTLTRNIEHNIFRKQMQLHLFSEWRMRYGNQT